MITNLILVLLLILIILLMMLCICIHYRNDKVYCFKVGLSNILFDELIRILTTYENDNEFLKDKNNYNYIKEKVEILLDKNSYEKYLFSFKPLKLKNWFTEEELEFIKYLKQYRR